MSAGSVYTNGTDTIVLIHGMWVTALSWEHWIGRYQARGYRVLAPNWPGMNASVEQLRRHPSTVAGLGVTEITGHYEQIIRELQRPPVIIGHCLGGLVAQMLLDRGLGAAGVSIDPAPARRAMTLPLAMVKAGFPALRNLASRHGAVGLTAKQFHHAFSNTIDGRQAAAVYERYHVPGPSRIIYQVSFAGLTPHAATRVDFGNQSRAPLLLIADGKDCIFPAPLTKSAFDQYHKSTAVTSYKEFPGRSHYTIGEPGWEEVGDHALRWAMENTVDGT